MPKNKTNKKKQPNRYLTLTSVSFQMGITLYLGASMGSYLDLKYNLDKKWFTILFVLVALIVSIYSIIKQLNRFNDDQ